MRSKLFTYCVFAACLTNTVRVQGAGCYPGSFGSVSDINILLLRSDSDTSWANVVKKGLDVSGNFASVDTFNAASNLPSLSFLQNYHAILVWSTGTGFSSPVDFGNLLADYWDAGGVVVVAMFACHRSRIQGRFGDPSSGYMLLDGAWRAHDTSGAALGEVINTFLS